jgi:hypothetical protein
MGWIRFSMIVMFSLGLQLDSAAGDKKSSKQHHKLPNHDNDVMKIEVDALSSPTAVSKKKRKFNNIGTYSNEVSQEILLDHINQQEVHGTLVKEQAAIDATTKATRSILPPPQLLPIFNREQALSFPMESPYQPVYWWNEALRERIEHYKAIKLESGFINNNAPHRYQLNPVELHVVKDFLNEKERIKVMLYDITACLINNLDYRKLRTYNATPLI